MRSMYLRLEVAATGGAVRWLVAGAASIGLFIAGCFGYFYWEERRLDAWYRVDPTLRPSLPPRPLGLR